MTELDTAKESLETAIKAIQTSDNVLESHYGTENYPASKGMTVALMALKEVKNTIVEEHD